MTEPTTTNNTIQPTPIEKMPTSDETAVDVTSSRYVATPGDDEATNATQDSLQKIPASSPPSKKKERESTEFYWTWAKFQKHLDHVKNSTQTPDPVYKTKSCMCIAPTNPVRVVAIKIAHHWAFDAFILSLILINCVFMIIGSPYAPCCRAGETIAEGGTVVSSWAEMQNGCALDGSTAATAAKSFRSFDERNVTECAKEAAAAKTTFALGQGKCENTGFALWRATETKDDRYPDHPAHFVTDYYWPWQATKAPCCIPLGWAKTNGIYTSQKPDSYPKDGPPEKDLQPQLCAGTDVLDVSKVADIIFTVAFTFEMVVKIIAMGFIMSKGDESKHMPGAYLRDTWNWLDFIVVIAAYVELSGLGAGISVLRTFRVLRPLRALNKAPSMKMLVRSLLRSLAPMVYVLLLMVFVLLLWGIVATQLWNGLLHGTCQYYDPFDVENADASGFVPDPGQDGILCGLDYIPVDHATYSERIKLGADPLEKLSGEEYDYISNLFYVGLDKNGLINGKQWHNMFDNSTTVARINAAKGNARTCADRVYGSQVWSTNITATVTLVDGGTREIASMMCRYGPNPNFDLSSFDNLGNAVLWIFASITLEGWVDSMYNVNQVWSYSSPFMSFFVEGIYFTFLYLIGSMFMLNLTLAVIWEEFENERERQEADEDELISQELHLLQLKNIEVQDREEAERVVRAERRAAAKRAEETGDPIPDPWGPPCIRNTWYLLAINKWFGMFITIAILVNTITMGLEYHNWQLYRSTYNYDTTLNLQNRLSGEALSQPQALTGFLEVANYIFTFIFIFEMVVKMIGLSITEYWKDNFNRFDFTIVMFSIVELILGVLDIQGVSGLSVLRSFRLLRVLKLAKSWTSLQDLLITIMASLVDVTVAAALALLMMFIFTLLGMSFFGGKWNEETFGSADDVPRANFDDFFTGFMAVFQVLTGENWNDLLWASYKTSGIVGWGYFMALTFIGNYMIFNLFLAILLAKFEEGGDEAEIDAEDLAREAAEAAEAQNLLGGTNVAQEGKTEEKTEEQQEVIKPNSPGNPNSAKVLPLSQLNNDDAATSFSELDDDFDQPDIKEDVLVCYGKSLFLLTPDNKFRQMCFALAGNKTFDQMILMLIIISSIFLAMDEPWVAGCACYDVNDIETHSESCTSTIPLSWVGYFSDGNSMGYYMFLLWSDLIITIVFTFEMVLKIIAFGFAFHKHAYLRNGWNVLDFAIVMVSLIALATGPLAAGKICGVSAGGSALKALRALRAFRALRPLRVIKRDPGLRLVINSLFQAAESIGTVMLVTLLFMMILAILGQQFFVGTVALCNDGDMATFPECIGSFNVSGTDCGMLPHQRLPTTFTAEEWATFANPKYTPQFVLDSVTQCELNGAVGSPFPRIWDSLPVNFDGFGHSLTTVFEVASGEMWPDIMVTTIDARGIGQQPLPNSYQHGPFLWYFMVQFMIAFVMLNVFIGVIIEEYNKNKDASEGSGILTNDQKIWVETMKLAMNSKAKKKLYPPVRFKNLRMPSFNLVTKPQFDYFIMACIMINVMFMGSSHYNQPIVMHDLLTGANLLFNIIFTIEMIIKWIGIGKQYFYDSWNLFDCFLVALSWIAQTGALPPSLASLFRIFRVARMVRLVRNVTGLLNLFKTLIFSIPALKNVAIIMILFMFIFSCFAMNTFGNIKHGELLTGDANFETFFLAFNTMWRLSSGESYNGLMHDINIAVPYCNPNQGGTVSPTESNCGNEFWAFLIMQVSFTVLNYILVNLFIAIILDNFSEQCSMSESKVTAEILEDFDEVWASFDSKGTGKISEIRLPDMLLKIEYPLGLKNVPVEHLHGKSLRKFRNQMIQKLEISALDGFITFVQTKKALTAAAMDDVEWDAEASNSLMMKNLDKQAKAVDAKIVKAARISSVGLSGSGSTRRLTNGNTVGFYNVSHISAAKSIQSALRGYLNRKNLEMLKAKWLAHIKLAQTVSAKQEMGAPGEGMTSMEISK